MRAYQLIIPLVILFCALHTSTVYGKVTNLPYRARNWTVWVEPRPFPPDWIWYWPDAPFVYHYWAPDDVWKTSVACRENGIVEVYYLYSHAYPYNGERSAGIPNLRFQQWYQVHINSLKFEMDNDKWTRWAGRGGCDDYLRNNSLYLPA